jgi:hypothetical protein
MPIEAAAVPISSNRFNMSMLPSGVLHLSQSHPEVLAATRIF